MKNIIIGKVKTDNVENFTTSFGIKVRRFINPGLRKVLKLATKRKIVLENYPVLEKNTPYIFASTHSFDEDIIAALATIDRSAYVLMGTTDQIDYNPQMYAAWINGMIYVDRNNQQSRKDSVEKMVRVLNSGSSVLIFPEGGWNNTENLLVQPLFAGPYTLAQRTGAKVVPIATFNEHGSNEIHMSFGEPIDFNGQSKKEALGTLRDALATMMFTHMEKYSTPIKREDLTGDIRLKFMQERVDEYMRVKWTRDVWDEELAFYKDREIVFSEDVWDSLKDVELTKHNAWIMQPILERIKENEKYNFKKYIKKSWNKK